VLCCDVLVACQVGPSTFAFRAELDFDGHHFARALEREWAPRFLALTPHTVQHTMAAYAEAVTTRVEEEVRPLWRAVPCCAVLCCAVLCCAVLCCVVLCCVLIGAELLRVM
jgi:hypothetical protein